MSGPRFDIDGVIFDLGSTLLEYETRPWDEIHQLCIEASYGWLVRNGYNIPSFEFFRDKQIAIRDRNRLYAEKTLEEWNLVDGLKEVLVECGIETNDDLANEFFDVFYGPISKQLTLFADSHSVLQALKDSGKKIGLISNTIFPESYHLKELEYFNLIGYFDHMIFSITHGYRKPHKSIYRKMLDYLNIDPGRILFVGDRFIEDVQGPRDNGMNAILKYREGRDYPDPIPEDIIVVKSLTEMLSFIGD